MLAKAVALTLIDGKSSFISPPHVVAIVAVTSDRCDVFVSGTGDEPFSVQGSASEVAKKIWADI